MTARWTEPRAAVAGADRRGVDRADESALVEALRHGDEAAFTELVERHHPALVRLAMSFVSTRAAAEEVAQETWLAVLEGIDSFQARSSLKTWLYRILVNRAKTRGVRESRSVPFSSLAEAGDDGEPSVDPERFMDESHPRWPGHWTAYPGRLSDAPEERLLSRETREVIADAIETLPASQRQVIELRDVEGCDSEECCRILGLTEGNQRVLLHRARSRVRAELERYLSEDGGE
jgi:RNA polymerase sigma-70 factor (ECF subfamily)